MWRNGTGLQSGGTVRGLVAGEMRAKNTVAVSVARLANLAKGCRLDAKGDRGDVARVSGNPSWARRENDVAHGATWAPASVLPARSRFGNRVPSLHKTVEGLAAQRGERIANSGAMAANVLGLTTRVPVTPVILTSGSSRTLQLGHQEIRLRHSPSWQLVLRGRRAGDAVGARLAGAGKGRYGA